MNDESKGQRHRCYNPDYLLEHFCECKRPIDDAMRAFYRCTTCFLECTPAPPNGAVITIGEKFAGVIHDVKITETRHSLAPGLLANMSTTEAITFAQAMGSPDVDDDDDEDFDAPPVVPELLANMPPEERQRFVATMNEMPKDIAIAVASGDKEKAHSWFEKRCLEDHGFIPRGLTAVGEAERQRAEEAERERIAALGRPIKPETEFVSVSINADDETKVDVRIDLPIDTRSWDRSNIEAAKQALRKKLGVQPQPTRSSEFEIPERLAEYLYVDTSKLVQFTDAGRVWLGKLQACVALALCLSRETFALSLVDQVAAFEAQAEALRKNLPVDPHVCRFFAGIWKQARRDELLELLPLLRYEHPELEDLKVDWIAGLLNASTMRGPEGTGNRADRRTYTAQQRNKKKANRKAQRNARKGNRR